MIKHSTAINLRVCCETGSKSVKNIAVCCIPSIKTREISYSIVESLKVMNFQIKELLGIPSISQLFSMQENYCMRSQDFILHRKASC